MIADRVRRLPRPRDAVLQGIPGRGAGNARDPAGYRDGAAVAARGTSRLRFCAPVARHWPRGVPGKVTETALKNLVEVAKELDGQTAVFCAPPDFTASRANKAAVKEFLASVKKKFQRVVWEPPPSWDADDANMLAADSGATAARDPLAHGTTTAPFAYYRLPGPAGHKSRYEDPAIERLGEVAAAAKNENAIYVFTNVDMFADAKRFKKTIKA